MKNKDNNEFVYFTTDDTVDVGKEALPEPPERGVIQKRIAADFKVGKFHKKQN